MPAHLTSLSFYLCHWREVHFEGQRKFAAEFASPLTYGMACACSYRRFGLSPRKRFTARSRRREEYVLSSTVLEVAIGFAFCYASIALITSSVYEAGASLFKLRARGLLTGVKALLNDKEFNGLAKDIYNHALVNPQDAGTTDAGKVPAVMPSYIEPKHFALALIDSIQKTPGALDDFKQKIDAMGNPQLKLLLQGMYARSEGKSEKLQAELAGWFDASMDRVSGSYKRMAQLFTFLIALAIAGLFNVDSFHLFRTLWDHPGLISQIAMPAGSDVARAVEGLKTLPLGWGPARSSMLIAIGGWLITASSALFGAPF